MGFLVKLELKVGVVKIKVYFLYYFLLSFGIGFYWPFLYEVSSCRYMHDRFWVYLKSLLIEKENFSKRLAGIRVCVQKLLFELLRIDHF